MLRFCTSLLIVFTTLNGFSFENKQKNDTLNKYGLRAGLDIQKIIRSASDKDYKGLSITSMCSKVLICIIIDRFKALYEAMLLPTQFGFREN